MNDICKIPVRATFTVVRGSSTPVMTSAEYVDIPASLIAAYLVDKLGADAIFSGEAGT